jgi:hypothetical protein
MMTVMTIILTRPPIKFVKDFYFKGNNFKFISFVVMCMIRIHFISFPFFFTLCNFSHPLGKAMVKETFVLSL